MAGRTSPAAADTPENKNRKQPADAMKTENRVKSGIPGLDGMMEGGFPRDNVIMIRGEAGTGKTTMCLQYLYHGAEKQNEPGVFISFAESKAALRKHTKNFGWNFERYEKENRLAIIRYAPHEVVTVMEEGGGTIRDTIESMKAKRLVIDSLTAYALLFETQYKAVESILNLFDILNRWETTTMVTIEHPFTDMDMHTENTGFLADGIIDMYHPRNRMGERGRCLEILKMRDTRHSQKMEGFKITQNGIIVGGE